MKNFETTSSSRLILSDSKEITVDLYSRDGFDLLSLLWIKVAAHFRVMYEPTWLGRPIIQFPTDIIALQEVFWQVCPDVVIETGVAHGGSLILSASMLELMRKGKVIGIDIEIRPHNRQAIEVHPLHHRIKLIEASSIDPATVDTVRSQIKEGDRVMVILDSNHTYKHVISELDQYAPLVSVGSYIVVHDGSQSWVSDIPNGKPEWKDDHPLKAIDEFLASNSGFEVDFNPNRWGITSSPRGFLKRVF